MCCSNHPEWATLDDLKNFQSSPACAEFLRNLPEHRNSQVSVESSAALRHLTVEDSSLLSPPASSRFLAFQRATQTPTEEVKGRVTVTIFVVPHQVDDAYHKFRNVFNCFCPRGSRFIASPRYSWTRTANVWFRVLAEDRWVEEKFGRLEPTQEDSLGRTIFCHFLIWPLRLGATREDEEASVANPEAIESWNQHIAQVMPPATTWEQERWDIRDVPFFDPFEDEYDPELTPEQLEEEKEQRRLQKEYSQLHPPEFDEWLNPVGRR